MLKFNIENSLRSKLMSAETSNTFGDVVLVAKHGESFGTDGLHVVHLKNEPRAENKAKSMIEKVAQCNCRECCEWRFRIKVRKNRMKNYR